MVNPDRSYIICHMMTTLDGKIASGIKGVNIFDDYYPLYSKLEHAFTPQVWMCGRVTSEEFAAGANTPLPHTSTIIDSEDFRSSEPGNNYMIAIDTKGQLRWKNNTLVFGDQSKHQLIVVVSQTTPKEYLANFSILDDVAYVLYIITWSCNVLSLKKRFIKRLFIKQCRCDEIARRSKKTPQV